MQISNYYNYSNYSINTNRHFQEKNTGFNNISFTSKTNFLGFFRDFKINPLNRFRDFTLEEYNKLSNIEKRFLRNCSKKKIPKSELDYLKSHELTAELIKSSLDKQFGTGEYVFIPIGRSPSSIGKALSYYIGKDNVKMVPLSNARRFSEEVKFESKDNPERFIEYLNSIGLSRKEIETSGKKYILTDYCESGRSLKGAKNLFESNEIWGEQPNVYAMDLENILTNAPESEFKRLEIDDSSYFLGDICIMLAQCFLKKFSLVARCSKLSSTPDAIIKNKQMSKEVKLFWFNLMDNISNKT